MTTKVATKPVKAGDAKATKKQAKAAKSAKKNSAPPKPKMDPKSVRERQLRAEKRRQDRAKGKATNREWKTLLVKLTMEGRSHGVSQIAPGISDMLFEDQHALFVGLLSRMVSAAELEKSKMLNMDHLQAAIGDRMFLTKFERTKKKSKKKGASGGAGEGADDDADDE